MYYYHGAEGESAERARGERKTRRSARKPAFVSNPAGNGSGIPFEIGRGWPHYRNMLKRPGLGKL